MDSVPLSPRITLLRGSDEHEDDKWIDVEIEDFTTPVRDIAESILNHDKDDWCTWPGTNKEEL